MTAPAVVAGIPEPACTLEVGSERFVPGWQYADGKPIVGVADVLAALADDMEPLCIDLWFNTPDLDLMIKGQPASPIQWLAAGRRLATVVESARLTAGRS